MEKPPIGIMPRYIWVAKRKREILDAVKRFIEAGAEIPTEWLDEYIDIVNWERKVSR